MTKLMRAGFYRLKKSVLFWGVICFTIAVSCFLLVTNYSDHANYNTIIDIKTLFLNNLSLTGVITALFASLFIGQDYSDGTLRNKIILHLSRIKIYLVNFILVSIISILMEILHLIIIGLIGISLFGPLSMPLSDLWQILFSIFCIILAYSAIFTFFAMLLSNKTMIAVTTILLAFGMMIASMVLINRLAEPEYSNVAQIINDQYALTQIKNPKYLSESQREIVTHLIRILPSGQCFLIGGWMEADITSFPLYSLGVTLIFTGTGIVLFKRKELK